MFLTRHPPLSNTLRRSGALARAFSSSFKSSLTAKDQQALARCTHPHPVLPAIGSAFQSDWTKHYHAQDTTLVVQPTSTPQVAAVLKYCNEQRIGVIPVGGNTGLVGGTMPIHHRAAAAHILLSTQKLNTIHSLNTTTGILHCQAGCILQDVQTYAAEHQWRVPLDIGAKGSCCIGGNLATNAGGSYYYRYGSLAGNVLGVQVVLADGRILQLGLHNTGSVDDTTVPATAVCNIKDNTGYKLHQLFLGSEGTLGIITELALLCPPLLPTTTTALVACTDFDRGVHPLLRQARTTLGEQVAAFEWMDRTSIRNVQATHPGLGTMPLLENGTELYQHYVLIETHGSSSDEEQRDTMEQFVWTALQDTDTAVCDGTIAQTADQARKLWDWREACNPAAAAAGKTYKYDVSLPNSAFESFISAMREHLSQHFADTTVELRLANWGHVLDGNLHFNVTTVGCFDVHPDLLHALEPYVFELVHSRGGSVSAEHGVGQAKAPYMGMVHDADTWETMRDVKQLFDPHGILNPGKIFPLSS